MKSVIVTIMVMGLFCASGFSQTILFQDDFEDGDADDWDHDPAGWQVVQDEGNYVFEGQGHYMAKPPIDTYKNITMEAKFKLINGGFHFNILLSTSRYYFPIFPTDISFIAGEEHIADTTYQFQMDTWYTAKAILENNRMRFFINDSLVFDYTDPVLKTLFGKIAFECIDHIHIDDILVTAKIDSQETKWIKTGGPYGGIGYDVRIDPTNPDIVYVTDVGSGMNRSLDGGDTWQAINEGIISRTGQSGDEIPVFSGAIDPNNTNIIWCGTMGIRGIYKSYNKGETWIKADNGIPDISGIDFRTIVVHPFHSDTVFAGCSIAVEGTSQNMGKIYKTEDGGASWREVLSCNALVRFIVINQIHPDKMYASTGIFDRENIEDEGIFKSVDGGETWFHTNNGVTNMTVGMLAINPRNPNILYAATGRHNGFGGGPDAPYGNVLKTIDGGQTWSVVLEGQLGEYFPVTAVAIDPSNPDIIYARTSGHRFYKSVNAGKDWTYSILSNQGFYPGHAISIVVHPQKSNIIFYNSYNGGIFKSEDWGETWHPSSKGYTGGTGEDVYVDPNHPDNIYAATETGMFKSYNGGIDWISINSIQGAGQSDIFSESAGWAITANPQNFNEVFFGTMRHGFIYRTINAGDLWQEILIDQAIEDASHGVRKIKIDPLDPSVVYVGIRFNSYASRKHEQSFGVYKSVNSGLTWEPKNNGMESTLMNINDIAFHPNQRDVVYIATLDGGIFKSINGGDNWVSKNNGILTFSMNALCIDPQNPSIIYAGAELGGLYKSEDGGESWRQINLGVDPEATIAEIVINPLDTNKLYAYDWMTGIYYSDDAGESWDQINEGLRTRTGRSLAISGDGTTIYAGTKGEGVFRLVLQNFAPKVYSVSPSIEDTVKVEQSTSQKFNVVINDLNNDKIYYKWFLNGSFQSGQNSSSFILSSNVIQNGTYLLEMTASDLVDSVSVLWHVKVIENEPPIIKLLSPQANEKWGKLSNQTIKWLATDNGSADLYIDIEYTINSGQNWHPIVKKEKNDGNFIWRVPNTPSDSCKMKITATDGVGNQSSDITKGFFSIPSLTISDLVPSYYQLGYLTEGDKYYSDRDYTITSIPDELKGSLWIITANNDKQSNESTFITFNTNEAVSVCIGHDKTIPQIPSWLSNWDNSGLQIKVTDSIGWLNVYSQNFQAGTVHLGGNFGTHANSMYVVLIKSQFPTSVEDKLSRNIPTEFSLSQNFPNPFNPTTTIKFAVKSPGQVVLKIYDVLGRTVETLVDKKYPAGFHQVIFDAGDLASGPYFYEIKMGDFRDVKKALFLK